MTIEKIDLWNLATRYDECSFDDRKLVCLTENNLTVIVEKLNEVIERVNREQSALTNIKEALSD